MYGIFKKPRGFLEPWFFLRLVCMEEGERKHAPRALCPGCSPGAANSLGPERGSDSGPGVRALCHLSAAPAPSGRNCLHFWSFSPHLSRPEGRARVLWVF